MRRPNPPADATVHTTKPRSSCAFMATPRPGGSARGQARGPAGTGRALAPLSGRFPRRCSGRGVCRVWSSSSGIEWYASRVGEGVTHFAFGVWLRLSQEARRRHHPCASASMEITARGGMYWRQQSRQTRVLATDPRGWEDGPHMRRAPVQPRGFGTDGTRTDWM